MTIRNKLLLGISIFALLIAFTYLLNSHEQLIKAGDKLYNESKTKSAYDKYRLAATLYPFSASAHLGLYKVFYANNDLERALTQLQIATELSKNPNELSNALKNLNNEINQPNKIREQIKYWESVAESKKDYRDAYIQLSLLHFQLYEIDNAREYLQKAKQIDPNNPTISQLEQAYK